MALTSTLYTGLSGMTVNQSRLNVIGNNIANANTTAFKSSRALFRPQFYVTDSSGGPPSADFGGTNPSQRGLGATVASIQRNFSGGPIESTGQKDDLAIDGDGFFVVKDSKTSYTRDGSFTVNKAGDLVTSKGEYVQGYAVDGQFNLQNGTLSNLNIPIGELTIAEATTKATLQGNLKSNGDVASSASKLWSEPLTTSGGTTPDGSTPLINLRTSNSPATALFADGDKLTLNSKRGGEYIRSEAAGPMTYNIDASTTLDDLNAFFQQTMGIDTTAETIAAAPAGYTPGVSVVAGGASDPANSARLQIIGNAGLINSLDLGTNDFNVVNGSGTKSPFAITLAEGEEAAPVGEGTKTLMKAYDSLGNPIDVNLYTSMESQDSNGTTFRFWAYSNDDTGTGTSFTPGVTTGGTLGTGTITFDTKGKYLASTGTQIRIDREGTGAATPLRIDLDPSAMTGMSQAEGGPASTLRVSEQDGFATGTLEDYSIGADGVITGSFSNSLSRPLGQIALATFDNPQGLIDDGANNFKAGGNSGDPFVVAPTTFASGSIRSGSLEQSNVDLSKEFIDMIVTSTGFSASSRVITTANQLMNELLQTSR
ncbi:MAG: flagellar hook-basal body complex protein [Tepidisphaeraceae bacterium]